MLDNIYILAGLIVLLFGVVKVIEYKSNDKPIKPLFKDGFIVFLCTMAAQFVLSQFQPAVNAPIPVFTDTPEL